MPRFNVLTAFSYQTHDGRHFDFAPGEHEIPADVAAMPFVQRHIERTLHPWEIALANSQPKPWPAYVPPAVEPRPVDIAALPKPVLQLIVQPSAAAKALTEAKEIMRARRALQEAVEDAQDELAEYQKALQPLMASLIDTTDPSFEERATTARQRLKELKAKLETAKAELAAFNRVNPTAEMVEAAAKKAEAEVDRQKMEATRLRFGLNVRRRIELLNELEILESEAKTIRNEEANYWTYDRAHGHPWADIPEELCVLVPNYFSTANPFSGQMLNAYHGVRRKAETWLKQWNIPESEPKPIDAGPPHASQETAAAGGADSNDVPVEQTEDTVSTVVSDVTADVAVETQAAACAGE